MSGLHQFGNSGRLPQDTQAEKDLERKKESSRGAFRFRALQGILTPKAKVGQRTNSLQFDLLKCICR